MRKMTIVALVVTGIVLFMFCVSAYFTYSDNSSISQDVMCENPHIGEICISVHKTSNNKVNKHLYKKCLTYRINKILNEKYPKENIIRENSENEVTEQIEEEPDEYHSVCIL